MLLGHILVSGPYPGEGGAPEREAVCVPVLVGDEDPAAAIEKRLQVADLFGREDEEGRAGREVADLLCGESRGAVPADVAAAVLLGGVVTWT